MAKLKPRARLIRTIGDKLISGPEAAIIELVKNSYDADSPKVEIRITPPSLSDGGKITIRDFGHGMTYDNIINNWLEPATDIKNAKRTSRSGRRVVLGAKGVGRFASASLGAKIKLISIAEIGEGIKKVRFSLTGVYSSRVNILKILILTLKKRCYQLQRKQGF